jgi:hypothetical protein
LLFDEGSVMTGEAARAGDHLRLQPLRFSVLIAAISHASFNEASQIISPNVPGPLGEILVFASVGLLALLAVVISKGTLAYNRDQGPVAPQVTI